MHKQKIVLVCLMVSAFVLSTSMAGPPPKFTNMPEEISDAGFQEGGEENIAVHERIVKENTKDYGKYDPPPALVKPPSKPIPN
ncbi:hypothetical protein V6N13_098185 [Hibiscus sabdariffa]|uniref:Uncharacterized protein n=1 Tax=Hibiscus sabdariffa TaxID=183260 RepID=A0ABR2ED01_9ROSI